MWNTTLTSWMRLKITWSRDHGVRTLQGRTSADRTPIMFLGASVSVNTPIATPMTSWDTSWYGLCMEEILEMGRIMTKNAIVWIECLQTWYNSKNGWCPSHIRSSLKRFSDMFQGTTWCTTWQNLTAFDWVDHREHDCESRIAVLFSQSMAHRRQPGGVREVWS
jgi:hypothetical protein